ncbi:MAG: 3-dehydroquinate dehydratase [Ruminococcaceae bacterium]|nr:3-dehydroquinate dehydratase [Oscillospiraceae bacterium]
MRLLILNGVNLNLTGTRSPDIYGAQTLEDINREIAAFAAELGAQCDFLQTNFEGELVEAIHKAVGVYDGIVLNAGAWTHYSYAIHDAIEGVDVPVVETHMSDITKREPFRAHSVLTEVCTATVMGLGKGSYFKAVELLCKK